MLWGVLFRGFPRGTSPGGVPQGTSRCLRFRQMLKDCVKHIIEVLLHLNFDKDYLDLEHCAIGAKNDIWNALWRKVCNFSTKNLELASNASSTPILLRRG